MPALFGIYNLTAPSGLAIERQESSLARMEISIDESDKTQVDLLNKVCTLVESGDRGMALANAYAQLGQRLAQKEMPDAAERCFTNCLTICTREPGQYNRNKIIALTYLSDLFRHQARYAEAREMSQQASNDAQEALKQANDKNRAALSETLAVCLNKESLVEDAAGNYSQGEEKARQSLALYQKYKGEKDPLYAIASLALADNLRQEGRYKEALPILVNAEAVLDKSDNKNAHFAREKATAKNNLGALYYWMGDYLKAEKLIQVGYQMRLKKKGEYSDEVANSLGDLGCTYQKTGQLGKAEDALIKALRIRKKLLGAHRETAIVLGNLGNLYSQKNLLPKAITYYKSALEMLAMRDLSDHPEAAEYQEGLGIVLGREKHYKEALKSLRDSLQLRIKCLGKNNPDTAKSMISLGKVLTWIENDKKDKSERDYGEADRYLSEGKQILAATLGVNHGDYREVEQFEQRQKKFEQ